MGHSRIRFLLQPFQLTIFLVFYLIYHLPLVLGNNSTQVEGAELSIKVASDDSRGSADSVSPPLILEGLQNSPKPSSDQLDDIAHETSIPTPAPTTLSLSHSKQFNSNLLEISSDSSRQVAQSVDDDNMKKNKAQWYRKDEAYPTETQISSAETALQQNGLMGGEPLFLNISSSQTEGHNALRVGKFGQANIDSEFHLKQDGYEKTNIQNDPKISQTFDGNIAAAVAVKKEESAVYNDDTGTVILKASVVCLAAGLLILGGRKLLLTMYEPNDYKTAWRNAYASSGGNSASRRSVLPTVMGRPSRDVEYQPL